MSTTGHFSLVASLSPSPPSSYPPPATATKSTLWQSVSALMGGILSWFLAGAGTAMEAAAGDEEGEAERMGHFLPLTTGRAASPALAGRPAAAVGPLASVRNTLPQLVLSSPRDGSSFLQSQPLGASLTCPCFCGQFLSCVPYLDQMGDITVVSRCMSLYICPDLQNAHPEGP